MFFSSMTDIKLVFRGNVDFFLGVSYCISAAVVVALASGT